MTFKFEQVQASDGPAGRIDDFLVDDRRWAIRYLVIDTQSWDLSKWVLIAPESIDQIGYAGSKVYVNLSQKGIKIAGNTSRPF